MSVTTYDIGDTAVLSAKFQTAGADADPTTITFTIKEPNGTTTAYVYSTDVELVKDSTGDYHVDWLCAYAGTHWWEMKGAGAIVSLAEGKFFVRESRV